MAFVAPVFGFKLKYHNSIQFKGISFSEKGGCFLFLPSTIRGLLLILNRLMEFSWKSFPTVVFLCEKVTVFAFNLILSNGWVEYSYTPILAFVVFAPITVSHCPSEKQLARSQCWALDPNPIFHSISWIVLTELQLSYDGYLKMFLLYYVTSGPEHQKLT